METEKPAKKLTASAVLKKYNLSPSEADEMLEQIYNTLEEQGEPTTEDNWFSRWIIFIFYIVLN